MQHRHGADVQGVAGGGLEGPDPALAEHDVEVAPLRDVLRGHQPLLVGRGQPALEHHRLARAADGLQQREVRHVAGADLQHVRELGDQRHVGGVHHLGDDRQPGLLARLGQDLQAAPSQALEGVRRGPGLVGPAPQHRRACVLGHLGGLEGLLRRLDRARPGDEHEGVRPDVGRGRARAADGDGGGVGVVLAADQLVGLGDPHDLADPGHRPQVQALEGDDVPDQPHDRALHAPADEGRAARGLDPRDDRLDLLGGRAGAHDDDHADCLLNAKEPRAVARGSWWSVAR